MTIPDFDAFVRNWRDRDFHRFCSVLKSNFNNRPEMDLFLTKVSIGPYRFALEHLAHLFTMEIAMADLVLQSVKQRILDGSYPAT